MSTTQAIQLETFASTARPIQATTDGSDIPFPDALHQGSRTPPDAHPTDQVNRAQSSQEVVRMPSPCLHGEEGPAGS